MSMAGGPGGEERSSEAAQEPAREVSSGGAARPGGAAGEPSPESSRALSGGAALDVVETPAPIVPRALSIGIAVGAYAISFGAVSVAAGLDVWQTQALSALLFSGASQFAFVGVVAAGGGLVAAVVTAWLLGLRNGLYALHLATVLSPGARPGERLSGWRRVGAAQFTIDETTAMALAYEADREQSRRAFWATGWSVFVLWNLGTLLGALGAASVSDPRVLGLDAAIPAGFLALLWPRLVDRTSWALAGASGVLALVLSPVLRPGIPVLAAAGIAVAGALWWTRERPGAGPAEAADPGSVDDGRGR